MMTTTTVVADRNRETNGDDDRNRTRPGPGGRRCCRCREGGDGPSSVSSYRRSPPRLEFLHGRTEPLLLRPCCVDPASNLSLSPWWCPFSAWLIGVVEDGGDENCNDGSWCRWWFGGFGCMNRAVGWGSVS
jgi:hypothetical protein